MALTWWSRWMSVRPRSSGRGRPTARSRARRATLAEDDDVGVAGLGVEHILYKVQHGGTRVPEQRAPMW